MHSRFRTSIASLPACAAVLVVPATATAQQQNAPAAASTDGQADGNGEIIVTARLRSETLTSVPVSVSALSATQINRSRADDLSKIGELVPSVIVGANKSAGGGSIAIRGISSPANTAGFEQSVSVAVDGVQSSNGRIAQLGFFDVAQVEVLEGPQALFFGKNSPAGVISIKTAMPTQDLEVRLRQSYEFVADQTITEATISGPLTDTLSARLAGRYSHSKGWLRNDARARPNPFYLPTLPAGVATLPGAADTRPGESDYQGRLTVKYQPTETITAVLKVFAYRNTDKGSGIASQVVGCPGAFPVTAGVTDFAAECAADNHTSSSDLIPAISQSLPRGNDSGRSYGRFTAKTASLTLNAKLGSVNLTALTGYNSVKSVSQFGFDQSAFSQVTNIGVSRIREFSQELRATTDFDGPLNFVAGAYYQHIANDQYNDLKFSDRAYVPATGRYDSVEALGSQRGRTFSLFTQAVYDITDQIEAAGGVRWTKEKKRQDSYNLYGLGAFNTLAIQYPGSDQVGHIKGRFNDDNWSPEATLTWRPDTNRTVYIAYKTAYKSGGFVIAPVQTVTTLKDIDFASEKVRGFELGAKGVFLHRRLRAGVTLFRYTFSGEQVSIYDAANLRFIIDNAGKIRQQGVSGNVNFQVSSVVGIHGAVSYARNRFKDFVGQCYPFAFAPGSTPATATPPGSCSFVPGAGLTLQQDYEGKAPARSPDFTGNVGVSLNVPVSSSWIGEITTDGFYSDGYFATDNLNPSSRQKSFWRLNASIGLRRDDDRWQVSLVGRNLTNQYYLLFGADRTGGASVVGSPGDTRAVVARGREVALQVSAAF